MNVLMNDTPVNNMDNIEEKENKYNVNLDSYKIFGDSDIVGSTNYCDNSYYNQDIVGGPEWNKDYSVAPYVFGGAKECFTPSVERAYKEEPVEAPTTNTTTNPTTNEVSDTTTTTNGVIDFGFSNTSSNTTSSITTTTTPNNVVEFSSLVHNSTVPQVEETPKKDNTNPFESLKTTKTSSVTELQRIVQKLEKLEKMINPNSKKSLILWEEDNSFKNLISSIVTYANSCDTENEFPIELLDKLNALEKDVKNQIAEGEVKTEELNRQLKENGYLSQVLSNAYVSAMAGTPKEQYEATLTHPEIAEYKSCLEAICTCAPESEEYKKAEKSIKSKITNLENSVHITIDLERVTGKDGALRYIDQEITPATCRLQQAYDEKYKAPVATEINGEEAVMALAVKKSLTEKIYDTFVRPFANLFKRKSKNKQ